MKSPKSITYRSLLVAGESTLPHSPGYLVNSPANRPESRPTGYSPSNPVRNPESYLDGYPASYGARHPPENPAGSGEDCRESNSADYSADCPDNRLERNPESNLESNEAGYSESYSADSLPDCLASYPESFDLRPVSRSAAATTSLQFDDLAHGLGFTA
jgi:hypothetical protein